MERGSEITVSVVKSGASLGIIVSGFNLFILISPLGRFVIFDEGYCVRLESEKEAA